MKRNPNGYGCITKLKGNRRRPWIVKVTVYDADGSSRQVPIGYEETEAKARILLASYNQSPWDAGRDQVTLVDLYNDWKRTRYPRLGTSAQASSRTAFNHMSKYYGRKYHSIRAAHMQDTINNCGHGYSTQGAIKTLWTHLDRYAYETGVIDKMYSQLLTTDSTPDTSRTPFTEEQVSKLWEYSEDEWVQVVLVYIYTGFRLMELLDVNIAAVDLDARTITAGEKTAAGRGRVVPIHHRILPFVTERTRTKYTHLIRQANGKLVSKRLFYRKWYGVMELIGAEDKKPHEARHTFETMLDNAHANRRCIDLLMGHKSKDVGNRIYNHKTLDQLRETVELLP